jgi:uncharacterized membrane protein YeaQ/YmgE (transglycosylase-associated protein family)
MGILGWIVLGLVVGALAKLIMPGKDPGGIIVTMIIGILGALLGGFIGQKTVGIGRGGFFDLKTWIVALVGSLILLAIWRLVAGRRART